MEQEQILKKLMEELGLDKLPEDKQNDLLVKMTELLLKKLFLETMERLGDKGRSDYSKLVDSGAAPEEIENFLHENISGYDEIMDGIVSEFKKEMLAING